MDDPTGRGARAQTTSPEGFIQKGTRDKRRMTEEPCEVETLTHGFEAEAGGVIPSSTVTVGREAATQCWVEQASGRSPRSLDFQWRGCWAEEQRRPRPTSWSGEVGHVVLGAIPCFKREKAVLGETVVKIQVHVYPLRALCNAWVVWSRPSAI